MNDVAAAQIGLTERSTNTLAKGEVDIWIVPVALAWRWRWVLPQEEVDRAARFRSAERKIQFEASRAASRLLLARYLGLDHAALSLVRERGQKPRIEGDAGLDFNVSHSQTTLVIAIGRDIRLGVDIEPLVEAPDFDGLSREFFSSFEAARLSQTDPRRRSAAFLEAWTRKEAITKAAGVGIADGLRAIQPPTGPAEGAPVVYFETPTRSETWYLYDLDAVRGHVGALAASRRPSRIRRRVLD
jgi:4'-phosphopantetheinyl transferase